MRSPVIFTVSCCAAALATAQPDAPRAYGYTIGDVVQRRVLLPESPALDATSLPPPGKGGQALELRSAVLRGRELLLDYQVMRSPTEVRIFEMPALRLRLADQQTLRIDAWPVTVAPLTPPEPSPRNGLGEMRPDVPPPPIATAARQQRIAAFGAALLLVGAWLAHLHFGIGRRRQRPFADAWNVLRRLPATATPEQRRDAYRALHAALNRSAGAVLFAADLPGFVARRPRFAGLALAEFFARSRAEFFGAGDGAGADIAWLQRLARDCRDAERDGA